MNAPAPQAVLNAITALAMDVLSARVLTLLCMTMMFALTAWTLYNPDYLRIVATAVFGLVCFLPIIALERRQQGDSSNG
jgi:hypothetical protein